MDAGIEKECSALGGLFQLIMNDMKASYPTWEDFVTKGAKLQSQLRTTIVVTGAFLDAFQKVADMATGTRGATKDIGSALTRMCMRHRSIESKLKLFTTALSESLITPLELKMEEWKKVASQLDKDHAKEYKKARADIKKKSSDTIKLQKKVKKGKDEARGQLDSALQDVNVRYAVLEDTEKRAVCRALIEERARYCSFVGMLKPVLDHEINMLGEVTHLQTILEDLTNLTAEPNKLPPASEQVILDLKGSDFNYTYQTPPASPSNTLSRKSSISSNYQSGSVRHVPSLDSISCAVDGVHIQRCSSPYLLIGCDETGRSLSEGNSPSRLGRQGSRGRYGYAAGHGHHPALSHRVSRRDMTTDAVGSTNQLAAAGSGGAENGMLAPPHNAYTHHGERARAMSASGKSCSARDQLALTLGALNSDGQRSSRDSLHCSSGYSTQTTTPSCSEDTIHTHIDYESISLHGDADSISLHHLSHGNNQSDFDKSSTIPRNSDLSFQYRKFAQSKRPSSTVSLLAEPELMGRSVHQLPSHTATIRRKPSSKPAYRRGTISGGVPIPISTPQVPLKAFAGNGGSDENVFTAPAAVGAGGLGYSKLCTSTQSLSALPPSSSSPYYQLVPGQMPIPVPVPTVPSLPPEGSSAKQQQQRQYQQQLQQQQQINQQLNHQQQRSQLQQQQQQQHYQQQFQEQQQLQLQQLQQHQQQQHQQQQQQLQQQFQQQQQQYQQQQQQLQQQFQHQQSLLQQPQQLQNQQGQYQQQDQHQQHLNQHQQQLSQQQKQLLFQQQQQQQAQLQASASQGEPSSLGHSAHYQPQAPPPCSQDQNPEQLVQAEGGDMLTKIRGVKLKRTLTNDRSAPLLPPPTNHK
ncbi:protein MTSS 1 isoform X2 [Dicentrarchus labrax]|uniref:protein MTSS 1 isoform X2 n=1 Tax=Dicentrarchus labrax TaxID=13489 RepID=UPI0021F5BD2E|nr:protein MTSS 1 isoform X2 [Dicentrarchus labrax]